MPKKKVQEILSDPIMTAKAYRLTIEERETHYNISEDDGVCTVYTSIPKDIRMFKKKGWPLIKESFYPDGELESAYFRLPVNSYILPANTLAAKAKGAMLKHYKTIGKTPNKTSITSGVF